MSQSARHLEEPLPEQPAEAPQLRFAALTLFELRQFIRGKGSAIGFGHTALEDFVTAVNEVATNSVRHGGGSGTAKLWHEDGALVCQIEDGGRFQQSSTPHSLPSAHELAGRGLWLAGELCDHLEIRSFPGGTVTRVHARRRQ